jgi:hypothetical protein
MTSASTSCAAKAMSKSSSSSERQADPWHASACPDITVAFPLSGQGRPPQRDDFGAQYTARLCLCERFAGTVARPDASLEAEATG